MYMVIWRIIDLLVRFDHLLVSLAHLLVSFMLLLVNFEINPIIMKLCKALL
ncbi:hypothetical protein QUF86_10990 [Peribacillus sp. NJ11]|uniref:hypothetical protein n=1 Tax=Peribacillus sp. NJ11 TaxID=3055861 RepID=UPI0025A26DCA|nr:hypothetical protein [Peribacillus sp. NJ11]MDM5221241.1 hypothetical protein [Peribacillus sp. NJ11]